MRRSLRTICGSVAIVLCLIACEETQRVSHKEQPAAITFYVATNGNDSWSGRIADPNPARTDGPFATPARARDAIRQLKAEGGFAQPVTVMIRGGAYELSEKLTFTPEDTGMANALITYTSYPGDRAVLSGGRRIAGPWRQSPGKPYFETSVPQAKDGQWVFHSLYVNGISRMRARKPNWGQKVLRAEGRAPGEDERQSFLYFPGDINPSWINLTDIDIVLLCSWTPTIHRIQEVLPARRVVRFHSSHGRPVDAWEHNFRYYLSNVFEELDDPGEWYLNRKTGTLYYYPMPGEDMATSEIIAPLLKSRIVELLGDVSGGRFIEHLRFRDLAFRHVDGDIDKYNGMYRQGHMYLDAAIYAEGLRSSVFHNCEISQVGEYAIEMADGCRENRIERCHIWDAGAGAMQIGVTDLQALLAGRMKIAPDDLVFEAEDAVLAAPFLVQKDEAASNDRCIVLPEGQQGGNALFSITSKPGKYWVLARVSAPSGSADSFTVQVNDGPKYTYDTGVNVKWFLSRVVARELDGKPVPVDLSSGKCTITVSGREAEARLDQLILRPMRAGESADDWRSEAEVLSNVIDNNCIHRLGVIWHGCYGIVNRFASLSCITHNDIFDTHWDPIGLDARWNWKGEKYSHGNVVAYNHLHHYGLRYHTDSGAIYQFGPLDTHIHHNLIHDGRAYPYICGTAGVYLDEQSRGALVENNLVYNVEWSAYFQNWGADNTFRNNIGAFARDGFIHRGGIKEPRKSNQFEARGNIYIANDNVAIRRGWQPGEPPPVLRKNMYHTIAPDAQLTFAGKTFAEWQAQGYDQDSLIADPGCSNPAKMDFSLKANAPAVAAIGFAPFDEEIKKAGLYGDPAWRSLPERQAQRTPSEVWTPDDLARLLSFSMDFEDMPDGYEPPIFRLAKEGAATFAVTSETACGGKKSYRCVDRKGLKKSFYPYIHLAPKRLDKGRITFSFDAMLARDNPAAFYVEFRGEGSTTDIGPSLHFDRDGALVANGSKALVAKPGTWCHVEITFDLGEAAPKKYTLLTRCGDIEKRQTIAFTHRTFSTLRWLGVSAGEDADGVFYLDNLTLRIE
ncbi:MAG: right-handed parallel beta-helix repeat-containing protein [Planctomycetota bacterium]